jgi:hypothetical protein
MCGGESSRVETLPVKVLYVRTLALCSRRRNVQYDRIGQSALCFHHLLLCLIYMSVRLVYFWFNSGIFKVQGPGRPGVSGGEGE